MWTSKKNVVMRNVYHGLLGWEYLRLAEQGHWKLKELHLQPSQGERSTGYRVEI
jgi:hypothetical protein